MRVTFGEIFGDISSYRSAVVLTTKDAEALANQMLRMIERRKSRARERAAAKAEASGTNEETQES